MYRRILSCLFLVVFAVACSSSKNAEKDPLVDGPVDEAKEERMVGADDVQTSKTEEVIVEQKSKEKVVSKDEEKKANVENKVTEEKLAEEDVYVKKESAGEPIKIIDVAKDRGKINSNGKDVVEVTEEKYEKEEVKEAPKEEIKGIVKEEVKDVTKEENKEGLVSDEKAVAVVGEEKPIVEEEKVGEKQDSKEDAASKEKLAKDEGKIYIPSSFDEAVKMAEKERGISSDDAKVNKADKKFDIKEDNKKNYGISFLASIIYHSNGQSDLSNRDVNALREIAGFCKQKDCGIEIVGHASSRTRDMDIMKHKMINYELSIKRTEEVKNKLIDFGIAANKITLAALSDTQPIKEEVMPVSETMNRRTEIYISY